MQEPTHGRAADEILMVEILRLRCVPLRMTKNEGLQPRLCGVYVGMKKVYNINKNVTKMKMLLEFYIR